MTSAPPKIDLARARAGQNSLVRDGKDPGPAVPLYEFPEPAPADFVTLPDLLDQILTIARAAPSWTPSPADPHDDVGAFRAIGGLLESFRDGALTAWVAHNGQLRSIPRVVWIEFLESPHFAREAERTFVFGRLVGRAFSAQYEGLTPFVTKEEVVTCLDRLARPLPTERPCWAPLERETLVQWAAPGGRAEVEARRRITDKAASEAEISRVLAEMAQVAHEAWGWLDRAPTAASIGATRRTSRTKRRLRGSSR